MIGDSGDVPGMPVGGGRRAVPDLWRVPADELYEAQPSGPGKRALSGL